MPCHWLGAAPEDRGAADAEGTAADAAPRPTWELLHPLGRGSPAADQKKLNGQMESDSWEEVQKAVFFQEIPGLRSRNLSIGLSLTRFPGRGSAPSICGINEAQLQV